MPNLSAAMNLTRRLCAVMALLLLPLNSALALSAQLKSSADGSQIEFQGRALWEYFLDRKEKRLDLRIDDISPEVTSNILTWKDEFIDKVEVKQKTDQYVEFIIYLKDDSIQAFDYQMESPSRLLIDLYKDKKEEKVVEVLPPKKVVAKAKKPKEARKPASEIPIAIDAPAAPKDNNQEFRGLKDGADPNYERFAILNFEISKRAQIAAQKNVFIPFPYLITETSFIKEIEDTAPVYEIAEHEGAEAERVKLLQTVFNNKRYALFLTGLEAFRKELPNTKYQHLLRFMEADAHYNMWKETNENGSYIKAITLYKKLLEDYPKSPLYERTRLLIAYATLAKKNYVAALQEFLSIQADIPNNRFKEEVLVSIGDCLLGLNKFEDAISTYTKVMEGEGALQTKYKSALKIGDVLAKQKNYDATIDTYKKMLDRFPASINDAPNAHYNIAESLFRQGKYLDAHKYYIEFLKRYPMHQHGGYALNRVGEILEIMTENTAKIKGAYLENTFRYNNTDGAFVSKLRIDSKNIPDMKESEIADLRERVNAFNAKQDSPDFQHLTTALTEEGLFKRGDLKDSLEILQSFYKDNTTSPYLPFYRSKIARNLTEQIHQDLNNKKYLEALRLYGSNKAIWLRDADRFDLTLYVAETLEKTSALEQAAKMYRDLVGKLQAIQGTEEEQKREVLENLPKLQVVNLRMGSTYYELKEFERSLQHLNMIENTDALSEDENMERIGLLANVAIEKAEYEIAEGYLNQIIKTTKALPEVVTKPYFKLAKIFREQKQDQDAIRILDKVVNFYEDSKSITDEQYISALSQKAEILLKQGKKEDASKYYQDLVNNFETGSEITSARYTLGNLFFEKGDLAKAEEVWMPLQTADNGEIWYKLAKEKLDEARWTDSYKKYLERMPASRSQ
ncbi:MAG: tetratricopeptide repeat protein [Bdellovibrionales bacterium]|nr:tetratricopeptide repeat protein [Bdellovibrionales bacterium]